MSEIAKMTISEKGINLIPLDVDINKLFSLTYTFDNLKLLMNTLLENQNIMYSKIKDLETIISAEKEDSKTKIDILEKKIKVLSLKKEQTQRKKIFENNKSNINTSEYDEKNKEENKEEDKDLKERKSSISFKKKEGAIMTPLSGSGIEGQEDEADNERSNAFIFNEELENIKNKLEALEQNVKRIETNSKFNPNKLLGVSGNSEEIQLIKLNQKSLEEKINEMNKDKNEINKVLDEMKIRMVDFNIVDLLKEANISEGSIDASKILVSNLEEKFIKKTQIIDEKIKKTEDDMNNLKNEFQNVKNEAQVINTSLIGFKSAVNEISDQVTKTNDQNSNMVNETNNKINEKYKKLSQKIEDEKQNSKKNYEKIKTYIKKLENISKEQKNVKGNEIKAEMSDNDLRCMAELTKRMADLEKQMKILYHSLDISKFKEEVAKLENELMQKVDEKNFFDLNEKVNLNIAIMNNIKESLERSHEVGNKNSKDINFVMRKLESLNTTMLAFKAALETLSGIKNDSILDPSRYLDLATFNEFIKAYQKDVDKIEKNIEDIRRLITELTDVLKTKASGEDMKTFEGVINYKLEELKILCVKKFSDKVDTNKNFKYMDSQIKYITNIIMRKYDKNESWLIAKKPLGGNICASCEAYIGELKGKEDYLVWNKYPNREKEKNYRIGNGFSHMLNMLNLDMKNQDNNNSFEETNNGTDVEVNKTPFIATNITNKTRTNKNMLKTGGFVTINRSNVLPKISGKNEEGANLTLENGDKNLELGTKGQINTNEENNGMNETKSQNPHIVKVFRKNKFSAPDISLNTEKNNEINLLF